MKEGALLGIKKEVPVILITQEILRVLGAVSGTQGKRPNICFLLYYRLTAF